ncbi:hypothetical protein NHP200010_16340 [Helicobacter bizzozeronii]|uniref:hypothetical protein n=1 Tax=Helicobacter bizzozeronii TaxID=56877 RepID=UPI00244D8DE9|nr:hypothetical protein [Helicobacter bizzozeronii]GMB93895.1 hypothetical protein NHP200010_16340 [Helicobacter bizzozeronii]
MHPYIVFNKEKILRRFKTWANFGRFYDVSYGCLYYRMHNPYYTRLDFGYQCMAQDGYIEIVK